MKTQESGLFVVFEGGEGSGKTAHIKLLAEKLQERGHEVVVTREPGGSKTCEIIRNVILDNEGIESRAELFLFFADRAQHVAEVIEPALSEGKIVICDRYSGSTFAYQLGGRQLPDADFVKTMESYARNHLDPNLVLYLDVTPEVGLQRRQEKGGVNRIDNEEGTFHTRVRDYFLNLVEAEDSWVMQSTNEGTKEENAEKIFNLVTSELGL